MMRKSVAGVAIVRRCAMVGADESRAAGIRVRLYSFPLCSVTELELPPSEWSIDYDSLDQGRDNECL
jgi:hypothetical protein